MKTVTVILNGFNRKQILRRQIDAFKNQSYAVNQIIYFTTKDDTEDYKFLTSLGVEVIRCSQNYGVWGRFTAALNASSDFVLVYDDDIIPGSNFIKNCIDCYTSKPGIYGINGCSRELDDDGIFKIYSWDRNNSTCINEVIYLCQCWFFPRCVLSAFWTEEVSNEHTLNRKIAEDMHLSAMANKYLELKSYVVPQPLDDTSMWGNIAGVEFGAEDFAIHKQPMYREGMQKMFNKLFFNIH